MTNLQRALNEVLDNEPAGQPLTGALRRLADQRDDELAALAAVVESGLYAPSPLTEVRIPKSDGGHRELGIPIALDRVLDRAVMQVLTPMLEPHLGPWSFGFRPGLGVGDAVRRVRHWRDEGFNWVAHTDIDDCFGSIDRSRLIRQLALLLPDPDLLLLLQRILERPRTRRDGGMSWPEGLAQGSPLSPLLCNLYLAEFDAHVASRGLPLVRYADDLVVLARSKEEAVDALDDASAAAEAVGLHLGADKSEVIDFATGFSFLGEEFNLRYPAAEPDRTDTPDQKVLYVGLQGSYAAVRNGRVVVTKNKEEVLSVPAGHVARVVSFGSVTLAPSLLSWALSSDADVVLCSRRGSFLGTVSPAGPTSAATRRQQLALMDDPVKRLALARQFIEGKLQNQRVMLQRRVVPEVADVVDRVVSELRSYSAVLGTAAEPSELLGIEGIGARRYFEAFAHLLPAEVQFAGRVTRPPGDVVNAALSYGYAILVGECTTALAAAGLDPCIGVLHVDRGSRVSLSLDLAEEFRPLLVDTVVLELVRSGALTADHGRPVEAGKGVLLTEGGRTSLVTALERRMLTRVHHLGLGKKVSYRRALHAQAQAVKRAIGDADHRYQPMLWRV